MEKKAALNGFKPRSYGDLVAIATLLALFMSCVAWGLKLEARIDDVHEHMMRINGQVGNGILPRAEERIKNIERRLQRLEDE